MQLNGIELISYKDRANEVTFTLECGLADALAMDGQEFTIENNGEIYKVFAGYGVMSVGVQGEYTSMRCMRKLDDAAAEAINGLDANVTNLSKKNDETAAILATLLGGE